MILALTLIGAIVVIVKLIAGACEKPYGKDDLRNYRLYQKDIHDPNISPKQLDRNVRAGKYR